MTLEVFLAAAGIASGALALSAALFGLYKISRRIGDTLGTDKEGRTVSERLSRVEHQLWENGGDSLADRVYSIEKNVTSIDAKMDIIQALLAPPQKSQLSSRRRKSA